VKRSGTYTVKITVGDATVEISGAEAGVVKLVDTLSDVLRGARRSLPEAPALPEPPTQAKTPTDIRSFFEAKKPSSDVEAAAAVAYYYQYVAPEAERKASIDSESLQEAFRLAKRKLPKKTIWTLQNARNAGYIESAGDGRYKLNPVGYNLVEHALGGSPKAEESARKKPKRGATRGKRRVGRKVR
jgi:hypothetical protein